MRDGLKDSATSSIVVGSNGYDRLYTRRGEDRPTALVAGAHTPHNVCVRSTVGAARDRRRVDAVQGAVAAL